MAERPFVMISCKNHLYYFFYSKGEEQAVLAAMVKFANDDRHNLTWSEVRSAAKHILKDQDLGRA